MKKYKLLKLRYDLYCSSSIHPAKVHQIGLEIIWSKKKKIQTWLLLSVLGYLLDIYQ